MKSLFRRWMHRAAATLVVAVAMFAATGQALADKLHLKDGRVLEGKIVREGDTFIFFRLTVGNVTSDQMFQKEDISKIERDDQKKDDATKADKSEEAKKSDESSKSEDATKSDDKKDETAGKASKRTFSGATRVAILNFGPPSDWQGEVDSMVGREIYAAAFRKVIPMLEKAKTDVVIIRVNSGGGALAELEKFHDVFTKEYKPRFRTVAWIESAISAAAMSPWVLEEYVFMPEGNMGACTGWSGSLVAMKGWGLEQVKAMMEVASAEGKKDPRIMWAMQVQQPLSVDVSESGEVTWRQDENGQFLLNRTNEVFTINARDAVKFKFAKGIAATKEEVTKVLGLQEVEWVAPEATELVDRSMRDSDREYKRFQEVYQKYQLALNLASQLPDKERRGAQVAIARRHLADLRRIMGTNPNFPGFLGVPDNWFQQQEEIIKEILARP